MAEPVYIKCNDCGMMTKKTWRVHICSEIGGKKAVKKVWNSSLGCWVMASKESDDIRLMNRHWDAKLGEWVENDPKRKEEPASGVPKLESCEIVPKFRDLLEKKVLGPGTELVENRHSITCYCDKCRAEDDGGHSKHCVCKVCRPEKIKDHYASCVCTECWTWKRSKGVYTGYADGYSGYSGYNGYSHTNYKPVFPWEGLDFKKWPNTYKYLLKFHFHKDEDRGKYIPSEEYRARILKGEYKPETTHVVHYPYSGEEC